MPDEVIVREDLEIIEVQSWGDITLDDMQGTLAKVLELHNKRGLARVLIDAMKVTSFPSAVTFHSFGSDAAPKLWPTRGAIAVPPEMDAMPRFFETVMRNRGASVRTFNSIDEALTWLLSEKRRG